MLCRFVITDLRVCMSSSFSIISSPYMVGRKGVRRTFRRTFFFMGLRLICYLCLCFGQSVVANMLLLQKHLDGCLLWQFILLVCSASCACITVSTFFRGLSSGYPFSSCCSFHTSSDVRELQHCFSGCPSSTILLSILYHVLPSQRV